MGRQVLLSNNRRAAGMLLGLSVLPAGIGGLVLIWAVMNRATTVGGISGAVLAMGTLASLFAWRWWRTPRLALRDQELEVHLRRGSPWLVPLDIVECFFLGQAPSTMRDQKGQEMETRNVVVRLAERASTWHQQDTERALGRWCDGYITVYGTWCEPLSKELVERMNHQLVEAKRRIRSLAESGNRSS